jgi:hypothetical protein
LGYKELKPKEAYMTAMQCVVPAITLVLRGTEEFERLSKQRGVPINVHTLLVCDGWRQLGGTYAKPAFRKSVTRRQWFNGIMGIQQPA